MRAEKVLTIIGAALALVMAGTATTFAQTGCIPEDPPGEPTAAYVPCSENLIVNGDFEWRGTGDPGFTSAYRPYLTLNPPVVPGRCLQATGCSSDNMWCEGVWVIGRNPANYHRLWHTDYSGVGNFGDHTTNDGLMLILNGAITPGTVVWEQTVTGISPNTQYTFSFWARSVYNTNLPALTVKANDVPLPGGTFVPGWGTWQRITYTWEAGTDTNVTFTIANSETAASGNDFAIDDIELCFTCAHSYYDLCAGQTDDIGEVVVTNDAVNLYVTFNITEPGWYLEETHVAVGNGLADIPQTKKGNPIPGQFPYFCEALEPMQQTCTVTIPLDGWCEDDEIVVATHAAVVEVDGDGCVEELFWASEVIGSVQGLRKDGSAVLPERSDPTDALGAPDSPQPQVNFYSLGFGGWVTLGFGYPIYNGPGDDIVTEEVTWGSYPLEQADVFGMQDGMQYFAGVVTNNLGSDGTDSVGLPDPKTSFDAVMLFDTTDPAAHTATADGFDLDAVAACYQLLGEETAWGDGCAGTSFPGSNWGTWFTYTINDCAACPEE